MFSLIKYEIGTNVKESCDGAKMNRNIQHYEVMIQIYLLSDNCSRNCYTGPLRVYRRQFCFRPWRGQRKTCYPWCLPGGFG